jgi:nucleotide-binding universal stress UspA family protein
MFKKILVAYDDSKGGKLALTGAAALAQHDGSEVTALWVQEPLPRYSDLPGEPEDQAESSEYYFQKRSKEVEAVAAQWKITIACVTRRGHAAKTIVTFALEEGYDLIVLGHSDHSALWGRLLGDIADRVCDHSHCSVLVMKQ